MKAAIDHLCEWPASGPAWPCSATCSSSAPGAAAFHREVGRHADARGVRVLAAALCRALPGGVRRRAWYPTVEECLAALPGAIAPGSAVLVKASRACGSSVSPTPSARPPAAGGAAIGRARPAEPDGPEGPR